VRIVFMGSGAFAIPSFEALIDAGHEVVAAVTQPDKEKGRGRELAAPPMKPAALARGVPVLQPRRIKLPEAQDEVRALAPELQVIVAYGQILPRTVIDIAPRGTVNVHASLLPRYRGAAPIQWAIVNGETETGVTTMLIDEGLDTGPTLLARQTPIGPEETAPELEQRLARLGAEVLLETVDGLVRGTITPQPQDHAQATLAPIIEKEQGRIDWTWTAHAIDCRRRGFFPWPGTTAEIDGRALKILRTQVLAETGSEAPGTLIAVDREGLVVACGEGTRLRLIEVQPESRKAMPAAAFAAGARLAPGVRLG
jgi:methionyl-tRNA formyltransferase